jgi:hypothetical protein
MAVRRGLPHIAVQLNPSGEIFAPKTGGGSSRSPSRVPDRYEHARSLLSQVGDISNALRMASRRTDIPKAEQGVYVAIKGRAGEPLATNSLDQPKFGLTLLSARSGAEFESATLFLSKKGAQRIAKVISRYRDQNIIYKGADTGKPKNQNLVDGLDRIRIAKLADLWEGRPEDIPDNNISFPWEVWLRPGGAERLRTASAILGIEVGPRPIKFPEAEVAFVIAPRESIEGLIESTLAITRLRKSSVTADFFDGLKAPEQGEFIGELIGRTKFKNDPLPIASVCLLDTGLAYGHPLISETTSQTKCFAVKPGWGIGDHSGHGTQMAGIAMYGDLVAALESTDLIEIRHNLESVKIIPPAAAGNAYDQLGAITAQAIEVVESLSVDYPHRTFCLATNTTEDTPHDGFPTLWSATIDQLAYGAGAEDSRKRLFCISAGNLRDHLPTPKGYLVENDQLELEAPGQSWNALTIGAYTELTDIRNQTYQGWHPLAPAGDLCPVSRTASWDSVWPIKPDFVCEGGNLAVDPADGNAYDIEDLGLLTADKDFPTPYFCTTRATSAAAANATRLAAMVAIENPDCWPETIRALLVNSCSWTPAMLAHLPPKAKKADIGRIMSRYGYGAPDPRLAAWSSSNSVSLIVQDKIIPYRRSKDGTGRLNEMKLYELPWPKPELAALGSEEIEMRVTLSYFIEPNPSEVARGRKQTYASHGLRFKINYPDEAPAQFKARINQAANLEESTGVAYGSDSDEWVIGTKKRDVGSIHSDIWRGRASDLASRSAIAIHPVGGWWKDRKTLKRWASVARFSLVVTISAPKLDVELYTPIKTAIAAATVAATSVGVAV